MKLQPPPLWRVALSNHNVDRWPVPARYAVVPAMSGRDAALRVIRWAHADVGVPPMMPLLLRSLEHAVAESEPAAIPMSVHECQAIEMVLAELDATVVTS